MAFKGESIWGLSGTNTLVVVLHFLQPKKEAMIT